LLHQSPGRDRAEGEGKMSTNWFAHFFDQQREVKSIPYPTKEEALEQACALLVRCEVRYIKGPNNERIEEPTIRKLCENLKI
jgi:hypothetical protein